MAATEKNYGNNPYVYGLVNVLYSFCRDYGEAKETLKRCPDDRRSMMIKGWCVDFADWILSRTGSSLM